MTDGIAVGQYVVRFKGGGEEEEGEEREHWTQACRFASLGVRWVNSWLTMTIQRLCCGELLRNNTGAIGPRRISQEAAGRYRVGPRDEIELSKSQAGPRGPLNAFLRRPMGPDAWSLVHHPRQKEQKVEYHTESRKLKVTGSH